MKFIVSFIWMLSCWLKVNMTQHALVQLFVWVNHYNWRMQEHTDLNHVFISGLALHSVWHVRNRPVCAHRHHLHWHCHRLPVQHCRVQDLCFLWAQTQQTSLLHSFQWSGSGFPSFMYASIKSDCLSSLVQGLHLFVNLFIPSFLHSFHMSIIDLLVVIPSFIFILPS